MGSIQYPRIYFTGYQHWNPNTVNSNDYSGDPPDGVNTWDPPRARFDWEYLEQQEVDGFDEVPAFLRTNIPYTPATRLIPPAEWGYYGGQECGFINGDSPPIENSDLFSRPAQQALTTGYTDTNGTYHDNALTEPWLGQPIQLEPAKMVDVNPESFWSSQIFANNFTLGGNGFSAPPAARMHSRFISTAKRNYNSMDDLVIAAGFGAVFQTCFEKDSVAFQGSGGLLRQQIAAAFAAGAEGLMLRYSTYATLYFQGDAFAGMNPGDRYPMLQRMGELYEQFAQDSLAQPPISRAYSKVAGWIGLWEPGELVSVPGGRFLIPYEPGQGTTPVAVTPSNLTAAQYLPPPQEPPDTDGPGHAPQPLGPATIEVATDDSGNAVRFTLDLANTFPERDSTCLKADFGTAKLGLKSNSDSSIKWVSEDISYDQATYEKYGGLVDLPGAGVTAAELIDGAFILQVESGPAGATSPVTALIETLATAQTDTRGMYAEQPNPPFSDGNAASPGPGMPSTSPTCEVQVRYQGFAPQEHPAAVKPNLKLAWDVLDYQLNSYSSGQIPIDVFYRNPATGQFVPFVGAIDVPGSGSVEVQVISKGSAIPNLIFKPYRDVEGKYQGADFLPTQGIGSSYYTVIKCLNWDNELALDFDGWFELGLPNELASQLAWDELFETYFYGFPVMRFIKDPATFQGMAPDILEATDPADFNQPGYMPVTRTWSAGQRHIMESYAAYIASGIGLKSSAKSKAPAFKRRKPKGLVEARSTPPGGEKLGHG